MKILIIGAGIVGLHLAKKFLNPQNEIFVLDKESYLAEHTSGRNSGVIHAGIFYQPGSLKETLCIQGNSQSYPLLKELAVPHLNCGKLVTFSNKQSFEQENFEKKLTGLGVDFEKLAQTHPLFKDLTVDEALLIKSTGIVDAATYLKNFSLFLENSGVQVLLNCELTELNEKQIITSRGPLEYDLLINTAGLWSDVLAQYAGLNDYEIKPCRGDYYQINQSLYPLPVYPFPDPQTPGLGVHLTPTLDGNTLIGPNANFIQIKDDYEHHSTVNEFSEGLHHLLPASKELTLHAAYSGNRPKLFKNGKAVYDFTILKKGNQIHLLGIESPGLTAAPAIAQYCFDLL